MRYCETTILAILLSTSLVLSGCNQENIKNEAPEQPQVSYTPPVDATQAYTGPPITSPDWHPGDRWLWSDGYSLEVSDVDGNRTRFERLDADDQWHIREDLFVVESQSATRHRKVIFRSEEPSVIFPLQVGAQSVFRREYMSNNQLKVHQTSWMVEGRETIKVPAGTFDCWILVKRTRSMDSSWTGYERWWYSPQVKHYVRMEYRYGPVTDGTRTLMAYSLVPTKVR